MYYHLRSDDGAPSKAQCGRLLGVGRNDFLHDVVLSERLGLIVYNKTMRPFVNNWLTLTAFGQTMFQGALEGQVTLALLSGTSKDVNPYIRQTIPDLKVEALPRPEYMELMRVYRERMGS